MVQSALIPAKSELRGEAARRQHRRDLLLRIVLPLVGGVGLAALFIVLLALLFSGRQIGIIASFAAVIIMVPLVVVGLIPYALLIVAIAGMGTLHRRTESLLKRGQHLAGGIHQRTAQVSKGVSRPFIATQKRLTWLGRLSQFGRGGRRSRR